MHGSPPTPIAINHDVRRFGFTKIEQEPFSTADHRLSVCEFCKRERLTESQFYAWRRTICERDGESSPSLVPASVIDPSKSDASIVTERVGVHALKLPASTPAKWLAELVLALESRTER
jgi:hypothetical protein